MKNMCVVVSYRIRLAYLSMVVPRQINNVQYVVVQSSLEGQLIGCSCLPSATIAIDAIAMLTLAHGASSKPTIIRVRMGA